MSRIRIRAFDRMSCPDIKGRKLLTIVLFVVACVCAPEIACAQNTAIVKATGRAQKDRILIRWAVDNAGAWKHANRYGFKVTRFTVVRDNVMLDKPEEKELGVFKPAANALWEEWVQKDDYAAIIAQAIYGESFEITDDQGILSVVNKNQDAEQRFILSLYAADRSFQAAQLAGWGLIDTDVKVNEKYLYRINTGVPANKVAIDSAAVFIGLGDNYPLPSIDDISAFFTDKTVMLSWDYGGLKDYYNAYYVERSSDGKSFYSVTKDPVTKMTESENKKMPERMHYVDTLGLNNVTYYYRVIGVTPFGEKGPPSKVVFGAGKKTLAFVPHITSSIVDDEGRLQLAWEFDEAGNTLISGFTVNQSETESGTFERVMNASVFDRSAVVSRLFATNYFTVTALAIDGESRTSFPVLVQPVDTLPPSPPTGLKVVIDTTGVARLAWSKNTEQDILGYRVLRSYIKGGEFTPLTDSVLEQNNFTDTLSMRMMNRKIYYTVHALDKRYNQSDKAPVVLALKPDVIPPASPVFIQCEVKDYKVRLAWKDSHDEDVAAHILYRRMDNEKDWKLIQRFKSQTPGEYMDGDVKRGHFYAYILISKDSSNLESQPAGPVTIKVSGNPADIDVKMFNSYVDRNNRYIELFWTDDVPNVEEYHLYRQQKNGVASLWRIAEATQKRIVDESPEINTEYTYGIKVVTRTGEMSRVKWVVVKY